MWAARVAGVGRAARLDQQHVRLLVCAWAVLHAGRDHEQLARPQLDVAVAELNRQPAFEYQEEVVGVRVLVPDELAARLDHGDQSALVASTAVHEAELENGVFANVDVIRK